jgi:hypothetical protein
MTVDRYQVYWLPDVQNALRELAEKARGLGILDALKQAVAQTTARLEQDPLEVGELCRQKGDIVEQAAANDLIWVNFAVDTKRKVVVVRRCWATARGGL